MRRRLGARVASSWPYLAGCGYVVASVVLFERTGFDARLPCLVRTFLGFDCPGCGLTRALQALLHGDPAAAWASNPLLFVLLPAILYYWLRGERPTDAARPSGRVAPLPG